MLVLHMQMQQPLSVHFLVSACGSALMSHEDPYTSDPLINLTSYISTEY
jgi:hypothetical protein